MGDYEGRIDTEGRGRGRGGKRESLREQASGGRRPREQPESDCHGGHILVHELRPASFSIPIYSMYEEWPAVAGGNLACDWSSRHNVDLSFSTRASVRSNTDA